MSSYFSYFSHKYLLLQKKKKMPQNSHFSLWRRVEVSYFFKACIYGFNVPLDNLSDISQSCLVVTGGSVVTFYRNCLMRSTFLTARKNNKKTTTKKQNKKKQQQQQQKKKQQQQKKKKRKKQTKNKKKKKKQKNKKKNPTVLYERNVP